MSEAAEVAIKKCLLAKLATFLTTLNPAPPVSWPNMDFTKPEVTKTTQWLRATIMPADSSPLGIRFTDTMQHFGIFQVDVFQGQGIGELAPARLAASIIAYFPRGTRMNSDGFNVDILGAPYATPMLKDDPWVFVPVRIPYNCFAIPA